MPGLVTIYDITNVLTYSEKEKMPHINVDIMAFSFLSEYSDLSNR